MSTPFLKLRLGVTEYQVVPFSRLVFRQIVTERLPMRICVRVKT